MGPTSQAAAEDKKIEEQKKVLFAELVPELGASIPLSDGNFVKSLYLDLATKARIDKFLRSTKLYKDGRWTQVPSAPTCEKRLYNPLSTIISKVLNNIGGVGKRRKVVDGSAMHLNHKEHKPTKHSTCPDLVIRATGPSFEEFLMKEDGVRVPGFGNLAACLDVKLERDAGQVKQHIQQLGVYARQMFIQQPNRRFVRSLILTQKRARLVHFDRSGVQLSPFFDFHKDPHTFIRLLLGLGSLDEAVLGLDTSIQWTIRAGMKTNGIITVVDENDKIIKYVLVNSQPIFGRHSIRGRGTVCWYGRDPETDEEVLIKDSWQSNDRTLEHMFLEKVKNVEGVVHMVSYDANRGETKDFRGTLVEGAFLNRQGIRVVLRAYGPPVGQFRTVKEVIAALRDAIAGHATAFGVHGVLHRDISVNNILLGVSGALEGSRGILIDFDMAIFVDREASEISADCRTGTRMFQSIMVLGNGALGGSAPAHDHLDDLESFYYVLCYIMHSYAEPGKPTIPGFMAMWDDANVDNALVFKRDFLHRRLQMTGVNLQFWGPIASNLLAKLHIYISGISKEKDVIVNPGFVPVYEGTDSQTNSTTQAGTTLRGLRSGIQNHYEKVLELFDEAIKQMEAIERGGLLTRPSSSSFLAPDPEHSSSKRPSEEEPEETRLLKRIRTDPAIPSSPSNDP